MRLNLFHIKNKSPKFKNQNYKTHIQFRQQAFLITTHLKIRLQRKLRKRKSQNRQKDQKGVT